MKSTLTHLTATIFCTAAIACVTWAIVFIAVTFVVPAIVELIK